ncbi:DNA repair protein RadA [Synechococcus sp. PCC 6312]|uniref:DNA repair protein RadA n=1 Tax=Synechococcus sp. (strain ATCC 27167 / PCC 6312) TaxID=195253 RepID=UPI00029F4101|nr:DNA repair protein RadA [Synechococcus sp. PCC 6312]AFY61415.1 DNA repair protein RadA [Synechococcus sp. PCC 6312]
MPRPRTQFICRECGAEYAQYFGRCSNCEQWNTLDEQVVPSVSRTPGTSSKSRKASSSQALSLEQITDAPEFRFSSGFEELDRVLGGGVVPGSLVLVGGDPGIGKSTLLLQAAFHWQQRYSVLYVCAEESGQQVKLRAKRISTAVSDKLLLLPENDLDIILTELEQIHPTVAVIDSIQAIYLPTLTAAPGSVSQVRECTAALMRLAKKQNISLFIVGHVTKEGAIAGPKVLEHLVDTVLYFEGERFASHRLLRAVKNRFGASQEIGVFRMVEQGLEEVSNPSALFLGEADATPGTATIVACEGTRPLVVELQSLVSPTSYPSPRRSTTGIEYNRFLQILAVLEKRLGIPLSKLDAYVSSSGGLGVTEPAADLGIAVAVVASFRDRLVTAQTVLIGEVGLGGQVRSVSQLEIRLKEALKLGFKRAIIPKTQALEFPGLEVIPVARVADALVAGLSSQEDQ